MQLNLPLGTNGANLNKKEFLHRREIKGRILEALELAVTGLTNREIATKMQITEKGVKNHMTEIFKRMKLKSRAQLINWYFTN